MSPPPNIERKLRRLLALANDSDSPESQTARALYEKLLAKYDLSPEAIEGGEPTVHTLRYKRGDKMIVARIVQHFGWPATTGTKRQTILVGCTRDEFLLLRDLYHHARSIVQRHWAILRKQQGSFVLGYLDRAFPLQWAYAPCPRCKENTLNYSERRGCFICGECGYRTRKVKQFDGDPDAYLAGIRLGAMALTGNRLPGDVPGVVIIHSDDTERRA